jgi:RNA polymerase sigma-70 factor (ECF subfamily)
MATTLPVSLPAHQADRLSVLFDTHYDRLYRLARRLAPTAEDALDLVQETFLKAARAPQSIPVGLPGEEAWLVRVLINIQRDQWRKAAVRQRHQQTIGHSSGVDSGQEAALIARATIWRALDRLRPRRRTILVMYELEGLAIPAIASLLGISAITVRWHLSTGRRDLARALKLQVGDSR